MDLASKILWFLAVVTADVDHGCSRPRENNIEVAAQTIKDDIMTRMTQAELSYSKLSDEELSLGLLPLSYVVLVSPPFVDGWNGV